MAKSKEYKRHACCVAVDTWLESDEGQESSKPAAFLEKRFLKNRLWRAFIAGWFASEKHKESELRVLKESRAVAVEQEQKSRVECNRLRAEVRRCKQLS